MRFGEGSWVFTRVHALTRLRARLCLPCVARQRGLDILGARSHTGRDIERRHDMKHEITVKRVWGKQRGECTCGRVWTNVTYDGGAGNRQSNEVVAHLREHGGTFART